MLERDVRHEQARCTGCANTRRAELPRRMRWRQVTGVALAMTDATCEAGVRRRSRVSAPHLDHQPRRRSRFVQYAPGARLQWRVWHPCRRCHATSRLCQWCVIPMTQRRPFPASCPLLSGGSARSDADRWRSRAAARVVIQIRLRFRCPLQPSPRATRPRPDTSATLPEKVRVMSGLPDTSATLPEKVRVMSGLPDTSATLPEKVRATWGPP